jgi:hypothetical protein
MHRQLSSSGLRLKELYRELFDRNSNTQLQLRNAYPGIILPSDETDPHAQGWFVAVSVPASLSPRALESLFSIYGLVESKIPDSRTGKLMSWYVRFAEDADVGAVLRAGKRLNVAGCRIDCYRLRFAPGTARRRDEDEAGVAV